MTSTKNSLYKNNLFEYNDWTGATVLKQNGGVACLDGTNGLADTYQNNTIAYCGGMTSL